MNYKNLNTGEVINQSCYNKLTPFEKQKYVMTSLTPTHQIDDDGDGGFLTTLLATEIISDIIDSGINSDSSSFNSGSTDTGSSVDFGGGDFGGGGAGSDF